MGGPDQHDVHLSVTNLEVIVKFTARYNEMAHCLVADNTFTEVPGLHAIHIDHAMCPYGPCGSKSIWQL
jgi:hypothetical protein